MIVRMSAAIDDSGMYRYSLRRGWGSSRDACVLFIMINPSTADAMKDDPTITRCIAFARAWGYGSLEVVNLFAFRSKDPDALMTAADPVGPDNDSYIRGAAAYARAAVLAHGTHKSASVRVRIRQRAATVHAILRERGHDLMCLGVTKDRMPRHPLFLRGDLRPVLFVASIADAAQPPPDSEKDNK